MSEIQDAAAQRSHYCGDLRASHQAEAVTLCGWVDNRRDHGGCIFIDLRDRTGVVQLVFDPEASQAAFGLAEQCRSEWVVVVRGQVRARGAMVNKRLATGAIEVLVQEAAVLSRSETPPFEIRDAVDTHEDKRLRFRYLDLRRPQLQRNLIRRHRLNQSTRAYLSQAGFLEIETPALVKHTPGGARNFVVPSRLHPGSFYALAESPQLYKQVLMAAGFDRYFQLVRCFRDEDLRVDRQPEFTQIDLEMSFVDEELLFRTVEGLIFRLWQEVMGVDLREVYADGAFPRLDFSESMARYGNDKPDRRFGLEHIDLTAAVTEHKGGGIPLLEPIAQKFLDGTYRRDLPAEIVKGIRVPAEHPLSRSDIGRLEKFVAHMGAKGLARARVGDDGTWQQSPLAKTVSEGFRQAVNAAMGAKSGDMLFFQFGPSHRVHTVMANLRLELGKRFGLVPSAPAAGAAKGWDFLWVVNPPLFEWDEESKRWAAAHHLFTKPRAECIADLQGDPGAVRCHRYDLVLNGFEIAGGSIRVHESELQQRIFQAVGIDEQEAATKFGFLLDAFRYGCPPHGGIALGMDRIAMLASGTDSIRDVIAFPKTQRAHDPMTEAPTPIAGAQLADLHLRLATS